MSQLLQSFIKRLQDATISLSATSGLGPGVEEFADMLWLAQYLPHKSKQQPKFWLLLLTMNCLAAIPFLRESPRPEPEPESPPDPQSPTEPGTLIDRPERITESQRKSQVKPLLVPAAAALRHPRQLARALRPLARKIDSRTEQVIDEEATAIAIAEKSFVGIVQKPASERWLELELVIEQSRIGAIWSRTCKEFIELLKRLGAFRVIRVWTLETSITEDEQHQPLLSAGLRSSNNRAMRCGQPNELLDSTGRRLVMVLSDCISPLWREGLIHDWLARWAKNGPAVIVQWFPTRYWSRTGLRAGDEVWLSALNPGTASDRLIRHYVGINPEEFQDFLAQLAEPQENFKTTSVVIPVVTLEPDSLEDWARVVVGSGDNQVVGRRFELRAVGEQWVGPLQPPRPLPKSGEERVRVFYETASDIAQELAGLMSLGPVSPEITNLIQETLLPESNAVHVAEVFLTGLLEEKSSQNYRFVPGAKELRQKSMTKIDRELVHQTLSDYLSESYRLTPREFQAFLVKHDDWNDEQWKAVEGFAELKRYFSRLKPTSIPPELREDTVQLQTGLKSRTGFSELREDTVQLQTRLKSRTGFSELIEYTVRLQAELKSGTGFFVAPGLILTCAHVVTEGDERKPITPVKVYWKNHEHSAVVIKLPINSRVDLALLQLENPITDHPTVFLDESFATGDSLYSFGYTDDYPSGEPRDFIYTGLTGYDPPLMTLRDKQVQPGFSGAPLLNKRTGKICGVIKRSQDIYTSIGGIGIPVSVIFEYFPELSSKTIKTNPFNYLAGRIDNPKLVFGREKEVRSIFALLNSGASVAIIGEPGIGKSSLLKVIEDQAESQLEPPRKPIYLDLGQVYSEDDFYLFLCDLIGIPECRGYRLSRELKKHKLLLILDNFEKMAGDGFTNQIKMQLRALAEGYNAPLRLVIAGGRYLHELFNDSVMTSPFEGIFLQESISSWDEQTIRAFIKYQLQNNSIYFTEAEISKIISDTQGNPKKVMNLCYQLYNSYLQ